MERKIIDLPNGFASSDSAMDYEYRQPNFIRGAILFSDIRDVPRPGNPVQPDESKRLDNAGIKTFGIYVDPGDIRPMPFNEEGPKY